MSRAIIAQLLTCVGLGSPLAKPVCADEKSRDADGSRLRVGTFDSRAVAVAYGRSEAFELRLRRMKAAHRKAKAEGNDKRLKELVEEGKARQNRMHRQAFSTGPIDDILEDIKDELPGIAREADIGLIVCKWDVVYQQPSVRFVDVTHLLVRLFNPDERTLKMIKQVAEHPPIPVKELEEHTAKDGHR